MSVKRAREFRQALTPHEALLWSRLRHLRQQGFHIRRQAPFRGYYLDFVCFERRLVIELDGGGHGDEAQQRHDALRDKVLKREGFWVMRFWNYEVAEDAGEVMVAIFRALSDAAPTRLASRATLPMKGRERGG